MREPDVKDPSIQQVVLFLIFSLAVVAGSAGLRSIHSNAQHWSALFLGSVNDYGKVVYFNNAVAGLEISTAGVFTWEAKTDSGSRRKNFPRADGTIEFVTRMTPQVNNYGSVTFEAKIYSSTSQ